MLIVATCASGKRIHGDATASKLALGTQEAVTKSWHRLLEDQRELMPARDMYKGRAFTLTRSAADLVNGDFSVLSAGLGYVRGATKIPGYDVTVRRGKPGSVAARVRGTFSAPSWWQAVQSGRFSADFVADAAAHNLVLVCLSKSYLDMVIEDLISIETCAPGRLRLFGRSLDRHLPTMLKKSLMPYDGRLDVVGPGGTLTDFAARALHDFVRHCDLRAGIGEHTETVLRRLSALPSPKARPARRRLSDGGIRDAILLFMKDGAHGSARALNWLRQVKGVSCEQARFAALYRQLVREAKQ